ncbi:INO80 complex subunit D-like isoform X2 [Daktulosphaira vitifoliae]|uniref:INO80 complex subunit D-like isoform X2 n=2 Tax=Daktulosphaira vitifoliae TaxID=58002 RepID=UPI0021AAEAC6|nr:INO80 complex subunit D-like isoform X2 [Daktulosphaira vitifoliae]
MQNVFARDMFSMGSFDGSVKCNGHVQLSGRTSKKDRKGCKKEKIETVLKNRLISSPKSKNTLPKVPKITLKTKNLVKTIEFDDNSAVDQVMKKQNVKESSIYNDLFLYNTPPTPPSFNVPETIEDRLAEQSQKKIPVKKRNKSKNEKIGSNVCKKSEKFDPCINDKNQLSCNVITIPPKRKYAKMTNWQKDCGTHHETLQRIQKECVKEAKLREDLYPLDLVSSDTEENDNPLNLELEDTPYQRFWMPAVRTASSDRDAKVKNLRSILRRRFHQLSNLPDNSPSPDLVFAMTNAIRHDPAYVTKYICSDSGSKIKTKRTNGVTMKQQKCCLERCHNSAIPCTRHCFKHILRNVDQLLFEHCSARTNQGPCTNTVFNIRNVQPLCFEHLYSKISVQTEETPSIKPKPRKRPKNTPFNKLSKRSKKKKQPPKYPLETPTPPPPYTGTIESNSTIEPITCTNELTQNVGCDVASLYTSVANPDMYLHPGSNIIANEEVGDEVLAGLDAAELSHASRLLDDHDDITSVFSQIPVDAFNDLFTVDKNGQYVPSREETEELERALEAVDMDVRSLERLSQSHMANILDPASLLADLPISPFTSS